MGGSVQSAAAGEAAAVKTGAQPFEEGRVQRAHAVRIRRNGAYFLLHHGSIHILREADLQRRDSLRLTRGSIRSVQRFGFQGSVSRNLDKIAQKCRAVWFGREHAAPRD